MITVYTLSLIAGGVLVFLSVKYDDNHNSIKMRSSVFYAFFGAIGLFLSYINRPSDELDNMTTAMVSVVYSFVLYMIGRFVLGKLFGPAEDTLMKRVFGLAWPHLSVFILQLAGFSARVTRFFHSKRNSRA